MNRILVVDDDRHSLELLNQELTDLGYEVLAAGGGKSALATLSRERIDLVLLDIMMPEVSGIDVLQAIRRKHTIMDLPVIMVTVRSGTDDLVQSLALGANDYVTKPINLSVLLARVRTQLHLGRLAALKEEFFRIATHELNAPLMAVTCGASLVAESVPVGAAMTEEMHGMLTKILFRASEMQQSINGFLDTHAIEEGEAALKLAPTDLNAIVQRVVEDNQAYAQTKGITLRLCLDSGLPTIPADSNRIRHVVQNLIGNALKYCREGDRVTVHTQSDEGKAGVEVSDSGPGLSSEDLQKAFRGRGPLSNQPTGEERSFGLGLAICKRLVNLHGGEVGAHNNPDGGSTFWFRLPLGKA